MNKQQLAAKIWESANNMRGKIEANEYKDYILGFIFYKFLSEKEIAFLKSRDWEDEYLPTLNESDSDTVDVCQENIGYFISYENLFSTWIDPHNTGFSAAVVRDALSAFNRLIGDSHKKVFDKIFDTLQTGLSKLGDTDANRTKAIRDLLDVIKDIPMDNNQDYDVLGFIYEYLIGNFAANAGKKAGEFYTPHEVALVMAEIVAYHHRDKDKLSIYDPTSGSASLLLNIGRAVSKHSDSKDNIKYYAQELIATTYNLTRMNLVMRGILPGNIITRNGDTLKDDWPFFDENHNYSPLFVDAVVSNPPYSQHWDPHNDPRFDDYGLAPKGKADYAFLLHNLYHTNGGGIMTIVLPHGVLFRGGEEGEIRKNLIEGNKIDAIIGLPANIFFGTGIPTIIMVLRKNRATNEDVLIIDASKGFVKEGKQNKLRASDIKRITDAYISRSDIPNYSRKISRDEIRANDYNLNIPRYVDSSEKPESYDIYATMFGGIPESELNDLEKYWTTFPSLKDSLFVKREDGYYDLRIDDVKGVIDQNRDVIDYKNELAEAFSDFDDFLFKELVDNVATVSVNKEEKIIGDEIFSRLESIPLIDKYEDYQLLDDCWGTISSDLEIIQSEGLNAVKVVEPNMVTTKKDGKTIEKQDGWKGRILSFSDVQKNYLSEDFLQIEKKEKESSEQQAIISEVLDNLSEEEKEEIKEECLSEEGDSFNASGVAAYVKRFLKSKQKIEDESLESRMIMVDRAFKTDKEIKKNVKELVQKLEDKTKIFIENQSDEDILNHLRDKWIAGLMESLRGQSDEVIKKFESEIKKLSEKYATTFKDIEDQIIESEQSLSEMIDQLCGSESDMKGLEEFQKSLRF